MLIALCVWFLTKVATKIMQFVRSCVCGVINNKPADKSCNPLSLMSMKKVGGSFYFIKKINVSSCTTKQ